MSERSDPIPGIDDAERSPLAQMLRIATPTILSMASVPVMTFVDRYFCGRLGPEELAAAGNGGMVAWVPASTVMGIVGVVSTFVSQNLGAGRPERGAAYAWNALWLVVAAWLLLFLPLAWWLPEALEGIRRLFGVTMVSSRVADLEVQYARVLLVGMVITLGGRAFHQFFFGMHRTMVPMVGVACGNTVNFFLTWGLVLGAMGMPRLGVPGSAVATVVGAGVELVIPLGVFLSRRYRAQLGTSASWKPSPGHVREVLKLGWPAGLMFGNEMICWGAFMTVLVAQFGPAHNAAGYVALTYMQMSFMPAVGMCYAVQSIVGKCIGAGRHDLAEHRTRLGIKVTMVYMGLCAACFVAFRRPMAEVLIAPSHAGPDAAEILRLAGQLLILAATFQLFDALGITLIGALRGAGDTLWPGVMTMILSWTVIVGGGKAATVWFPEWKSFGPWVAASLYIILFALGVGWRWRSGAWRSIKLVRSSEPVPEPA